MGGVCVIRTSLIHNNIKICNFSARENASHQRFLINDAFEKRIAREEDEIRIREQLRLAGDVAHAGLVVDDEEDMLSKALAEEAEKDAKFDQEKKVRSEDVGCSLIIGNTKFVHGVVIDCSRIEACYRTETVDAV